MDEPVVSNAADENQVAAATVKEKLGRERELEDMKWMLNDVRGRRVLWKVLGWTGMFRAIWEPSAKIHFNGGQQSLGLQLWSECEDADQQAVFLMMMEAKAERDAQPKKKEK